MSALAVPFPTLATRKDSPQHVHHPVLFPCSQPGPFSNNPHMPCPKHFVPPCLLQLLELET